MLASEWEHIKQEETTIVSRKEKGGALQSGFWWISYQTQILLAEKSERQSSREDYG